jgi:hypothetical protein
MPETKPQEWTLSVKSVVMILVAFGTVYAAYLRVQSYERTVGALQEQVRTSTVHVAALERAVVELTVELRTKGVITYAGK